MYIEKSQKGKKWKEKKWTKVPLHMVFRPGLFNEP